MLAFFLSIRTVEKERKWDLHCVLKWHPCTWNLSPAVFPLIFFYIPSQESFVCQCSWSLPLFLCFIWLFWSNLCQCLFIGLYVFMFCTATCAFSWPSSWMVWELRFIEAALELCLYACMYVWCRDSESSQMFSSSFVLRQPRLQQTTKSACKWAESQVFESHPHHMH